MEPRFVDGRIFGEGPLSTEYALVGRPDSIADAKRLASGPIASTVPARSQPTMYGIGSGILTVPLRIRCRSDLPRRPRP